MKTVLSFAITVMMMSCNGASGNQQANTLPDTLQVGQSILNRDTTQQAVYPTIDEEQRDNLARQMALDVPDNSQFIGRRSAGDGITLEAYKIPRTKGPDWSRVVFVTRDNHGDIIDHVDLREFHTSEHKGPMTFGGNRFYTTDASVTFDGPTRFTLHRVMTLTSIFLKDRSLTQLWRVEWDNHYMIGKDGRFLFNGQQETYHTDEFESTIVNEYMSHDRP